MADLLGFDGIIECAFDAIGNIEFYLSSANAIGLCALDLGRTITDMMLWVTEEEEMISLAPCFCCTSSIMPQKHNPIALEHLRSSLGTIKGLADAIITAFYRTPYGDIADYEVVEEIVHQAFVMMDQAINLFNAIIATMDVNIELLRQRATKSFSVVTELADQLYRSCEIPFRRAHHFVATLVAKSREKGFDLRDISKPVFCKEYEAFFGEQFKQDYEKIIASLDPQHFVDVRETIGGTGRNAMDELIKSAYNKVQANEDWCSDTKTRLLASEKRRGEAVEAMLR